MEKEVIKTVEVEKPVEVIREVLKEVEVVKEVVVEAARPMERPVPSSVLNIVASDVGPCELAQTDCELPVQLDVNTAGRSRSTCWTWNRTELCCR